MRLMPSSAADADVLRGMEARWNASTLAVKVPGFWAGRVPAQDASGTRRKMPYATARSEKAKDPQYFTYVGDGTDTYIDFRRVTLEIYSVGESDTGALIEQAKAVFDRKVFPIPNIVYLVSCLSMGEPHLTQDPTAKKGEDVWIGCCEFEVTTSRAVA
jgi:hypothetical protein